MSETQLDKNVIVKAISTLQSPVAKIETEVLALKERNPHLTNDQLAGRFADRIVRLYAGLGAATAAPSVIPGLGLPAQVGIEAAGITGDLLLMLRWIGTMVIGVGLIYERDVKNDFTYDYLTVLGLWGNVLIPIREAAERLGKKVVIAQFNKRVSGKVLQKINQKVGTTIVTKYGTKRGGVALGRVIPFGVGMAIGGGFNYLMMRQIKQTTIKFYQDGPDEQYGYEES